MRSDGTRAAKVDVSSPPRIEILAADPTRPLPLTAQPPPASAPQVVTPAAATFLVEILPQRRTARVEPPTAPAIAAPQIAADTVRTPAAQPLAEAQQPPLDLSRNDWMESMIERIETLRDAAGTTRETRIRLTPNALGTLDVSVQQDGDALQIRFTADSAATRTLLAEAAPRLNELAESRGLRLGETAVDAGSAGAGREQRRTHEPEQFLRVARSGAAEPEPDTATDHRIA